MYTSKKKIFLGTTLISAVFFFLSSFAALAQTPFSNTEKKIVKAIEVTGNKTISIATILSKIKTRVGQEYLTTVISDDIKRLYNTGYFSDVGVDPKEFEDGLKVFIYVEEKPIIEEITFSKTKQIKTKAIERKISTKSGKFLDKKTLKDDIDIIKDLYAKKGLTTAEVDVETFVDEVTNKASLHFVIREGYKRRIKKILIYGNTAFKDKKILKVVKSKKKWWFNSGYLKDELLKEDAERIISFYEKQGYIDAAADYSVEYLYKGNVEIVFQINEGKRYFVGDVAVLGNDVVSDKQVLEQMKEIQAGGVFSRERLTLDIANIRTLYFDQGYIFADVQESTALDSETGKVDIKIDIAEDGVAYIEKIKIQGNSRTRDIVVRRELRMTPGDRFDGTKLRRSRERLTNLGYFEDVSFDIEDTDTYDRKDLVVNVKEAKTGTFSFGGGFSTVDKVVGFVEVEQRNFDIMNWPTFTGGGQRLTLRAETGSSKNNFLLSFTEPWIFDHPVSFGFDIYKSEREREEDTGYAYDQDVVGGQLRLAKQFTDFITGGVSYKLEEVEISNLDTGVSQALMDEEGTNKIGQLGFSLSRDSRDSVFTPTKGLLLSGYADVAGKYLGGDREFYRLQTKNSYYIPLKWNSVLEFRTHIGIVDAYGSSSTVPIFERFFAGGSRSIRGYDERAIGPKDSGNGDPVGGESIFVANIEYTIPLVEFIKMAFFFDTGEVGAKAEDLLSEGLKSGAGIGLRVKTPIGPINLDYGFPLDEVDGEDDDGKFYFSVSRGF